MDSTIITKKQNKISKTLFMVLVLSSILPLAKGQLSSSISVSAITTPTMYTCSGKGTFVVRVSNITSSAISSVVLRDTMPTGISYVSGSVSGSGVTIGSPSSGRIVHFNIASIPASSFVDVTFEATAACNAPTSGTIQNSYRAFWGGTLFSARTIVPLQILFPSLSITVTGGTVNALCLTKFVRKITICNGGFAPVDSVTVSDAESNNSLTVVRMVPGTFRVSGLTARTVLKAADFATVGNGDGKLDQNECITVDDTLMVTGWTSPINGIIRADWGCGGTTCTNGTTNNVINVSTTISSSSTAPSLTRSLSIISRMRGDSAAQIYGNEVTYREVVRNNGTVVARNCSIWPAVYGLKYIFTDSLWASKNGGPRYRPTYTVNTGGGFWFRGSPDASSGGIFSPSTYTGKTSPNNVGVNLGDMLPGDSIVVTFLVKTAGPIFKVGQPFHNNWWETFCGSYHRYLDGPSVAGAVDARLYWEGCPAGAYQNCVQRFPTRIYNGRNFVSPEYDNTNGTGHFLARFRGMGTNNFIDSSLGNKCSYFDKDTVKIMMQVDVLDLPFYTSRSKFFIRIKTNGGVKWDGNLSKVYGRLSSWTNAPWYANRVVDRSSIDSTIEVHFSINNCPVPNFTTRNAYNSYSGGVFRLGIQFVNLCPGPAVKRIYITRVYTIDTVGTDPAIETGYSVGNKFDFAPGWQWNSTCPGSCADGIQILNYAHNRITLDKPDNNGDGIPDASGSLNHAVLNKKLITWGDTLQIKTKMVVKTTVVGGVPYLYIRSTVNYSDLSSAVICNNFLKKAPPIIKITTASGVVYNATSSTDGVNTSNTFLLNLSLIGAGGFSIPGYTAYQNGDTVELTENIVYLTVHQGWGVTTWGLQHVPYTSTVANPTVAQRYRCDSVICNFQTLDYQLAWTRNIYNFGQCTDSAGMQLEFHTYMAGSSCGWNPFTAEIRQAAVPELLKVSIPASSGWTVKNIYMYYQRSIQGTGQCAHQVNQRMLPTSTYYFIGDTLVLNARSLVNYFGYNIDDGNLRAVIYFNVVIKKTTGITGCDIDHVNSTTPSFTVQLNYKPKRPMLPGTSCFNCNVTTNTYLNIPNGPINSAALTSNVAAVNVLKSTTVINYSFNATDGWGNKFLAIPPRTGIVVDSVKDAATNVKLATVAGSNIYRIGASWSGIKNYNIYVRITSCKDDTLFVYADRVPCSGYPTSYAAYTCKNLMSRAFTRFITTKGELQMVDSIYTSPKDICTKDTVEFKVVNSQTPTARDVKISFKLPPGMSLNAGETQLKRGTGAYVTVSDPILVTGEYIWTLPSTDTLAGVAFNPNNILRLRCGISTVCGYNVGTIITSQIAGKVACGEITSLFNSNPPTLAINGVPTLNYLSNVKGFADPISGLNNPAGYDYRVKMLLSGIAPTGSNDSVSIVLTSKYKFVSYNPGAPGSYNAPVGAPVVQTLPNGDKRITWKLQSGISQTDSIKFTFKYNEINKENKCGASPANGSFITTTIGAVVTCALTGLPCNVGLVNGSDTVGLQSVKPSLRVVVSNSFAYSCPTVPSCGHDYVHLNGTIVNNGSAPITTGTPTYLEVFYDIDNNGSITAADTELATYTTTAAIPISGSTAFTYADTMNVHCPACVGKNLLVRFSEYPNGPSVQMQVLCDSSSVQSAGSPPQSILPVDITGYVFNDFDGNIKLLGTTGLGELRINGTNAGGGLTIGAPLHVNLIDTNNRVLATTPVQGNGSFQFPYVFRNRSNLRIQLTTNVGIVGSLLPASALPPNWIYTGENKNGQAGTADTIKNGIIPLNTGTNNISLQNFGIEMIAEAHNKTYFVDPNVITEPSGEPAYKFVLPLNGVSGTSNTPVNSTSTLILPGKISGTDLEDGNYGGTNGKNPKKLAITTLPVVNNALLVYFNGVSNIKLYPNPVIGQPSYIYWNSSTSRYEIPNANANNLKLFLNFAYQNNTSFQYAFIDSANAMGTVATYLLNYSAPLELENTSVHCVNQKVSLTLENKNFELNEVVFQIRINGKAVNVDSQYLDQTHALQQIFFDIPTNNFDFYRIVYKSKDGGMEFGRWQSCKYNYRTNEDLVLYPNPNNGLFTILNCNLNAGENFDVTIQNTAGKIVFQGNYNSVSQCNRVLISSGITTSGVYIVSVTSKNETKSIKIVVNQP